MKTAAPFRLFSMLALLGALMGPAFAQNQTAPASPAAPPSAASDDPDAPILIPELKAAGKTYENVRVREVTPTSVIIQYHGGMASVALADLPPDLQQRFGYEPAKAAVETARLKTEAESRRAHESLSPLAGEGSMYAADRILQNFGAPPKIFQEVNMRPRFEQLGIDAKNQGARPSCAVFAVVSALEFQQAPPTGPAPRLSEEYLIWATLKTLGKAGVRMPKTETPGFDIGFSLVEVTQALRTYGIALESEQPYHLTVDNPRILEPDPSIIDSAKLRCPVNGYLIPGREPASEIGNMIQVLNQGVPVIAGLKWPAEAAVNKTGVLDAQPGQDKDLHAIMFVGYRSPTGRLEDTQFLFKNSYGNQWGDAGYGLASYHYLEKNLQVAMFMDVR
jgi:hypothetical protein